MSKLERGGGTAELTLSATPLQLADGAACTMRLEISVNNRDTSAEEVFEWNCTTYWESYSARLVGVISRWTTTASNMPVHCAFIHL